MAKAATKSTNISLSLDRGWQWAFIVVTIASFLAEAGLLVFTYMRYGHIGAGTWTYQITSWAYPVFSALAGLVYACRRTRQWVQRIFWALFLAELSYSVVNLVLLLENELRSANHWFYTGRSGSYWLAFGWDWATMAICFVLYCAVLLWLGKRQQR